MTARQRAWLLPPAAVCLMAGILAGRLAGSPVLPLLACAAALGAVLLLRGGARFAACMVLSAAIGAAAGQAAWHPVIPEEGMYEVRGIVSDDIRRGSFGQVRVFLSDVSLNGRPTGTGAYWTFYSDDEENLPEGLAPGREARFCGEIYAPGGKENPDGYDLREELLRRGVTICAYGAEELQTSAPSSFSFQGSAAAVRASLSAALRREMGEEAGGVTAALLLGTRSTILPEDRAAFARLGIAHILSVSGFHTGILILLLNGLLRLFRAGPKVRLVLDAVFLSLYCILCGMSVPVLRASLFLLIAQTGKLMGRPRNGLQLLSAVLILLLIAFPAQLTGISFRLTFGAMLGIILALPYLQKKCPVKSTPGRRIWMAGSVALAAQIGVLAPMLYDYQELPLLSLAVNLPASFFASGIIAMDWIVLLVLPVPGLRTAAAAAAGWITRLFLRAVRAVSLLPGITLWTPAANAGTWIGTGLLLLGLCLFFRFSRRTRTLLIASGVLVVGLSLIPLPHHGTEYIQFSVGNADAAVLWDEDTLIALDTGNADGVLSGFLRRRRLTPDAVILTHLHTDHAGGLQSLIQDGIPIPLIFLPEGAELQQIDPDVTELLNALREGGTEICHLARGDTLDLPSGRLTVLWPEKDGVRPGQDANHYSLVSILSLHGVSLLHTGDITGEYESASAVPADLLKAAHHGSAASTSPEFLSAVAPGTILLSCARQSREAAFSERASGIPVLSTSSLGAVTVRFARDSYTVIPYLSPNQSGGR